jgi:hypothetical protein
MDLGGDDHVAPATPHNRADETDSSVTSGRITPPVSNMPFGRDLTLVRRLLVVFDEAKPKSMREIYPPSGPNAVSRPDLARALQLASSEFEASSNSIFSCINLDGL